MAEGGVVPFLALVEFFFEPAFEVVVAGELDGGAVGDVALDDDFACAVTAACAAGDLDNELEGAFCGAEVLDVEGDIGVD